MQINSKNETIGRYNVNGVVKDILFHAPKDQELLEYVVGNSGYYGTWTYDLKSSKISKLTMEWIEELPHDKRDKRTVIRHLMSKMSSENSGDTALMVGRWGGRYTEDGHPPTYWINSSSIFEQRLKTGKAVKYGQCWCFAECMTSMLRYLNIPCRTVCGVNIMIDENLDNGIDFKQDLRKDESEENTLTHLNKNYLDEMFNNLLNEQGSKSEWDNLKIYDCGDSIWNSHYWNEVYIDGNWEVIDSTPTLISEIDGKKMLGPSKLLENDSVSIDFDRFFTMVNSPFRLWATESIIEDDKIIDIPYVYSVIFPHSKKKSKYLNSPKILELFNKASSITMKSHYQDINITSRYKANDNYLNKMYLSRFKFKDNLYLQTVYLDYVGNVIKVDRFKGTFEDHRKRTTQSENIVPGCYLISCLAIELKPNPEWIAFCSYYE